ncbi:unnamed protein product [Heligmosomoides polygyrus]|uniref:COesterase domain-containing protein n=1 Tax=Heligmosomoides polygyrus TaxID=6339 RepID=A0A183FF62_HELPZ|nr:unnamed protein product [Heligmosomoides polygyrus]
MPRHGCRLSGTSTARYARLPMCSARLRLAMHGCRRVRNVYGSPCTVADVFGTSSESLRTLDDVFSMSSESLRSALGPHSYSGALPAEYIVNLGDPPPSYKFASNRPWLSWNKTRLTYAAL